MGRRVGGDGGRSAATHQQGLVELKQAGELFEQLVHAVQPLEEDRTLLAHVVGVLLVAAAVAKLVAEVQPVGLYKQLETLWITRWRCSTSAAAAIHNSQKRGYVPGFRFYRGAQTKRFFSFF